MGFNVALNSISPLSKCVSLKFEAMRVLDVWCWRTLEELRTYDHWIVSPGGSGPPPGESFPNSWIRGVSFSLTIRKPKVRINHSEYEVLLEVYRWIDETILSPETIVFNCVLVADLSHMNTRCCVQIHSTLSKIGCVWYRKWPWHIEVDALKTVPRLSDYQQWQEHLTSE